MMNWKSRLPNLKLGFTITRKYRTLKKMSFKYINTKINYTVSKGSMRVEGLSVNVPVIL